MTNELTEKEAQALFAGASTAIKEADPIKMNELFADEPAEKIEEVKEDDKVDESANTPTDDQPDDQADLDKEVEENQDPPQGSAEGDPKDKKDEVTGGDEPDALAKLQEQLDKLTKENHSLRSQAGRVPHVQRRLKELDEKLEKLTKDAASPSSRPSATIQPKVQERLKNIRETDAELAEVIESLIVEATNASYDDSVNRQKETLTMLRQQEVETYRAREVERLLEKFPNAAEVVNSPTWKEWKKEQSPGVIGLAESDNADDVSFAFEKYAKDMLSKFPQLAENKAAVPAQPTQPDPKAAQIEEERNRKKATAANVASSSAQGKVSIPDDPNALFAKYIEQIRKQNLGD